MDKNGYATLLTDTVAHGASIAQTKTQAPVSHADTRRPVAVESIVELKTGRACRTAGQGIDQTPAVVDAPVHNQERECAGFLDTVKHTRTQTKNIAPSNCFTRRTSRPRPENLQHSPRFP